MPPATLETQGREKRNLKKDQKCTLHMQIMKKTEPTIYNFGSDGREACWSALKIAFGQTAKPETNLQIFRPVQKSCDSSQYNFQCSNVEKDCKNNSELTNSANSTPTLNKIIKQNDPVVLSPLLLNSPPRVEFAFIEHNRNRRSRRLRLWSTNKNLREPTMTDNHEYDQPNSLPDELIPSGVKKNDDNNNDGDCDSNNSDKSFVVSIQQQTVFWQKQQWSPDGDLADYESPTYVVNEWCSDAKRKLFPDDSSSPGSNPPLTPMPTPTTVPEKPVADAYNIETTVSLIPQPQSGQDMDEELSDKRFKNVVSKLWIDHERKIQEIDNNIMSYSKSINICKSTCVQNKNEEKNSSDSESNNNLSFKESNSFSCDDDSKNYMNDSNENCLTDESLTETEIKTINLEKTIENNRKEIVQKEEHVDEDPSPTENGTITKSTTCLESRTCAHDGGETSRRGTADGSRTKVDDCDCGDVVEEDQQAGERPAGCLDEDNRYCINDHDLSLCPQIMDRVYSTIQCTEFLKILQKKSGDRC